MRLALRWALLAVPGFSDHFLCEYERALRAEVVAAEADAAAEAEALNYGRGGTMRPGNVALPAEETPSAVGVDGRRRIIARGGWCRVGELRGSRGRGARGGGKGR